MEYVIIGNGVAGTSAAESIRQFDQAGNIAMIGDEKNLLAGITRAYLMGY